ncbi:uncharacterized mitochondrial protein-like protein [Tanacetum coccineum]
MTHPHPNRRFVPQALLTRSGKINTAGASVNTAVRPGNPQQKEYKEKGVIDSGCSRHMTGNKCYLTEYEDLMVFFVSLWRWTTSDRMLLLIGGNRTLIEAARTMLVDSTLPTTFCAEAVNTACYESKLMYCRTRDKIVISASYKKTEPEQEYILIPFCTTDPLISQGPKDSEEDSGMKLTEMDVNGTSDKKVWTLVDLPNGKRDIGTKWVFRNKKDERGIVIRNKARLVAQGYTQEEGIDYDEVFAPVSRIEAIWLFLAYASYMGFIVYQMDVKSAFLYGTIEEEKEDGIFISQDKYVAEILKKFDFATMKTASTPMEPNKALVKDEEADSVDVHLYRSMIGSLMYLTASRPDITFAVYACARFQVTPKTSHLHVVKRIFRYLKGQPKLGLRYPRDSSFDLEAILDSDYAGASLDRKSTTGGVMDSKSNA